MGTIELQLICGFLPIVCRLFFPALLPVPSVLLVTMLDSTTLSAYLSAYYSAAPVSGRDSGAGCSWAGPGTQAGTRGRELVVLTRGTVSTVSWMAS